MNGWKGRSNQHRHIQKQSIHFYYAILTTVGQMCGLGKCVDFPHVENILEKNI